MSAGAVLRLSKPDVSTPSPLLEGLGCADDPPSRGDGQLRVLLRVCMAPPLSPCFLAKASTLVLSSERDVLLTASSKGLACIEINEHIRDVK